MTPVVYRMFDASGHLLYVGQSMKVIERIHAHQSTAAWFPDVASIRIDHMPTRAAARHAESEAIRTESPLHNVQHADHQHAGRSPRRESSKHGRPNGLHLMADAARFRLGGRTQLWWATQAQVSAPHVSELMRGIKGATPDTAARLADALDVPVASLFTQMRVAA